MFFLIVIAGLFVAVQRLLQRGSLSRLLIFGKVNLSSPGTGLMGPCTLGALTIAGVHFATNLLPRTNCGFSHTRLQKLNIYVLE